MKHNLIILLVLSFLLFATQSYSNDLQFRDASLKDVASVISEITNKNIIVPSDIDKNISLYANPDLSNSELLSLFYSALLFSGYDYKLEGNNIHIIPLTNQQISTTNQYKAYKFDFVLGSNLIDILPKDSKVLIAGSSTVVFTHPSAYKILMMVLSSSRDFESSHVVEVVNVLSLKPSDFLVLKTRNVSIKAFDLVNRVIVSGQRKYVSQVIDQINQLDSSLKMYQVDLFIVSASQSFNRSYNLNLRLGTDLLSFATGGGFSSSGSAPYVHQNNYNFLFNWIKNNRFLSIVQKPHISLLDGKSAKLLVGQEVPFQTSTYDPESNTSRVVTSERKNVGLSLRISINSLNSGKVRVFLNQELSSISQTQLDRSTDIITDKQTLETTLDLYPNRFYLIGGLSYKDSFNSRSGSPIFEDYDILNRVFTDTDRFESSRDLLIFIQLHDLGNPLSVVEG